MPWAELLDTITTAPTSRLFLGQEDGPQAFLDAIRREQPAVVWYPGSGQDFTPLLYAQPDASKRSRLAPFISELNLQGPSNFVLWMSDFNEALFGFPDAEEFRIKPRGSQPEKTVKIEQVGRFAIPVASQIKGRLIHIPLAIFRATVGSGVSSTVLYSAAESETLLRHVFIRHKIPIRVVAIVKQAGFSGQRSSFNHYRDLPQMLNKRMNQKVKAYLVDRPENDNSFEATGYCDHGLWDQNWGHGSTHLWRPEPPKPLDRNERKQRALHALE